MSSPRGSETAGLRQKLRQEEMEEKMLQETSGEENVTVCIRVRPFNRRELELQRNSGEKHVRSVIEMPEGLGGKVVALEKVGEAYKQAEVFQFTKSFWSVPEEQQPCAFAPVGQQDVFESVGIPVVKNAFAGFHNCVFAYGQTGSGKTHTMMGDFNTSGGNLEGVPGIIPQLCKELFERIKAKDQQRSDLTRTFDVKLSAIEIYNEQVRDLFWRSTPGRSKNTILKVRKHPVEGAFVDQLTTLNPKSWEECIKAIEAGVNERTVAATLMNDESSRSHSVFQITLTQTESVEVKSSDPNDRFSKPVSHTRVSRINLVDLAGSERLKKSGAQGQHLKEAATINQSLSTLKKVIDALVHNSKEPNPKKQIIVPFRESMLTMLLSHSLGGNSKTTMISCVSPHFDNQEETLLTLRYANRTKGIVNHTTVNEDNAAKAALQLKHQILALQRRLEDGEDEEAEELKDQLEVGKSALKDLEQRNAQLEQQADEMRTRTKQEEGARYAAAFYNSVKMAMLQQQKGQLEVRMAEIQQRLETERAEIASVQGNLSNREGTLREQEANIAQLQVAAVEQMQAERTQMQHRTQLDAEASQVQRKLDREVELRYAQKLVNSRRLKKAGEASARQVAALQEENDVKLTAVILQAAEQYELQVRQFADADAAVKDRISKAELELPKFAARRAELEREVDGLEEELRARDRAHARRIDEVESHWKQRYVDMKASFEKRIEEVERSNFEERRKWEEDEDEESVRSKHEVLDNIAKLEREIKAEEARWNGLIAVRALEVQTDADAEAEAECQKEMQSVADTRQQCEEKMAAEIAHLDAVDALVLEHRRMVAHLQRECGRLTAVHDGLKQWAPHRPSAELQDLIAALRRDSVGAIASVPPPRHSDPLGPSLLLKTPTKKGKVTLPPVKFFPV